MEETARRSRSLNKGDLDLRVTLSIMFRRFGLEVVHIELGENPFDKVGGHIKQRPQRTAMTPGWQKPSPM